MIDRVMREKAVVRSSVIMDIHCSYTEHLRYLDTIHKKNRIPFDIDCRVWFKGGYTYLYLTDGTFNIHRMAIGDEFYEITFPIQFSGTVYAVYNRDSGGYLGITYQPLYGFHFVDVNVLENHGIVCTGRLKQPDGSDYNQLVQFAKRLPVFLSTVYIGGIGTPNLPRGNDLLMKFISRYREADVTNKSGELERAIDRGLLVPVEALNILR